MFFADVRRLLRSGVAVGCGCYNQYDYQVDDPQQQMGKDGGKGVTIDLARKREYFLELVDGDKPRLCVGTADDSAQVARILPKRRCIGCNARRTRASANGVRQMFEHRISRNERWNDTERGRRGLRSKRRQQASNDKR